jgi:response regulator RpfG family c-di-GMP phosphodiesterase
MKLKIQSFAQTQDTLFYCDSEGDAQVFHIKDKMEYINMISETQKEEKKETTILYVSENPEKRQEMGNTLDKHFTKVITCPYGFDCMSELDNEIDLILIDFSLDSIATLAYTKKIMDREHVPVIVMKM